MTAEAISTEEAPTPRAAYSQAVRRGPLLFLSGQVGTDPRTGRLVSENVAEQTRQTLANLGAVLAAANSSWSDVVSVRVYLVDQADYREMNAVYDAAMVRPYPARTTVYCGLNPGNRVEMDLVAVVDQPATRPT
ncbi:RidA family protein [Georgenia sp. H159]|uniref:RidA family protein n=1 Tax=Georgenia sp. H159 TaxID=3076115 RepID=UPI002D78FBA5|nr:RidA family protein [Georgenia sp. H159]